MPQLPEGHEMRLLGGKPFRRFFFFFFYLREIAETNVRKTDGVKSLSFTLPKA